MHLPDFIRFASDATIIGFFAALLLALSTLAMWGDWRRRTRRDVNAVGIMPWRDIAALTTFAGMALLAMAVMGWLKG